jgi:four helix bundle protein
MIAKDFTELACWQLAAELKQKVYALIARPLIARDFKFCDQIRESTRSAPMNIAEGFGKYDPPEFKRFLNIAIGSLSETQNHLHDALDQKYLEESECAELLRLAKRARGAAIALRSYLESCPRKHRANKRDAAVDRRTNNHRSNGEERGKNAKR